MATTVDGVTWKLKSEYTPMATASVVDHSMAMKAASAILGSKRMLM